MHSTSSSFNQPQQKALEGAELEAAVEERERKLAAMVATQDKLLGELDRSDKRN